MQHAAQIWLAAACASLEGARRGVLHVGPAERGPYPATARWPDVDPGSEVLAGAALRALSERRAAVTVPPAEDDGDAGHAIALPLLRERQLVGCVAVEVAPGAKPEHAASLRRLGAALPWLDALLRSERGGGDADEIVSLLSCSIEPERLREATTALANDLAARLGCERVAIGMRSGERMELLALSHSARFERSARLVQDLEAALEEALDQEATIVHPPGEVTGDAPVFRAHTELAARHGPGTRLSVPFAVGDRPTGAIGFEWRGAPSQTDVAERARRATLVLGPLLALRREAERPLRTRARRGAASLRRRLFGPGHPVWKAGAAAVALGLAVLTLLPIPHRISAQASLEGRVQRAVVAAVDGYVLEARARAGDVVREGDLLASLDDRDLALERRKWQSEREQARKEYREALAAHERSDATILAARMAQAEAELALVEEQLVRTTLTAPFDGIVVKGDLSQSLGSPVARGDVLFEVAPLDDWRVMLEVDERDVGRVAEGQRGALALAARPGRRLPLSIERITPIASAAEGRNVFRVEARLEDPPADLRPGLEGVAKVRVGHASLLQLATGRIGDELSLRLWGLLP